ncbi:hypothetical protein BH23PLA1_BH23PLA1_33080 [soil metagenome]
MRFLLDTDVMSAYIKRPALLAHRFLQNSGRLALPTIVLAELYHWAYARPDPAPMVDSIQKLFALAEILDFDPASAETFGRLRADLSKRGVTVAPPDLIIASTALTHGLTVVSSATSISRPAW